MKMIKLLSMLLFVLCACLSGCKKDKEDILEKGSVTDIQGNVYETVKIGNLEWMTENLRVKYFTDEEEIAYIYDAEDWQSTTTPAYTYYNVSSM